MSELEPLPRINKPPAAPAFAVVAVLLTLASVAGAKSMQNLVERGDLPRLALVWREPVKEARASESVPHRDYVLYRRVEIDGVKTSAIAPLVPGVAPLSPCGAEEP